MRDAFIANASPERGKDLASMDDLEALLRRRIHSAHKAWPRVELPDEAFVAYLAERLSDDGPAGEAIELLRTDDLYLAFGCAQGLRSALDAFHDKLLPVIMAALTPIVRADQREEIVQRLLARLFVGSPKGPDILKYRGRGRLAAWVHITAVRDAYRFNRSEMADRRAEMDVLVGLTDAEDDPELKSLKRIYRTQFKVAFEKAFAELSPRQRNVLRHEHFDGLNIDQIGVMYGVHRTTVARWRMTARQVLLKETRRIFREDYKLTPGEFDSAMRLIESELEVSLPRLLELPDE